MRNRNLGFSLLAAGVVCIVPMLPAGCSSSSGNTTAVDSGLEDSGKTGSDAAKTDAKGDAKSDAKGGKDGATKPDTSTGDKDAATKGDGGSDATLPCVPAHCAPYTCGATACLTSCAVDTDCATGNFCTVADTPHDGGATGTCAPLQANSVMCGGADQCTSGFCVDAVCCDEACTGPCQRCGGGTCSNVAEGQTTEACTGANACSAAGSCLLVAGQDCTMDSQCLSGECEGFDGGSTSGTCM